MPAAIRRDPVYAAGECEHPGTHAAWGDCGARVHLGRGDGGNPIGHRPAPGIPSGAKAQDTEVPIAGSQPLLTQRFVLILHSMLDVRCSMFIFLYFMNSVL